MIPPAGHSSTATSNATGKVEVVPDSEEERVAEHFRDTSKKVIPQTVIVISSDEEDEATQENHDRSHDDPFAMPIPGSWAVNKPDSRKTSIAASNSLSQVRSPKKKFPPARRIVESSESGDDTCSKNVIIELTDSDSEEIKALRTNLAGDASPTKFRAGKAEAKTKTGAFPSPKVPLYDGDDDEVYIPPQRDEAILVLDELRNLRKTIPLQRNISRNLEPASPTFSPKKKVSGKNSVMSVSVALDVQLTPPLSVNNTSPSKRQPGTGKKAAAAAKLEELKVYAQSFFDELNASVFDSGIPASTQLTWNNRLTTTAGKASYHRSRDGVATSTIELAIKILDNEDRIRRTLSHEMCHLACWIINGKMNENHGSLFKSWAAKVHAVRPDIIVSTTHDYEIKYPYRWKCQQCSLIYGRFSNSIKPDKQGERKPVSETSYSAYAPLGCSACNGGRLDPLFTVRARKSPQTLKASRMAASKPRDSPSSIPRPSVQPEDDVQITCIHDTDSDHDAAEADSDIELITTQLGSTTINAS